MIWNILGEKAASPCLLPKFKANHKIFLVLCEIYWFQLRVSTLLKKKICNVYIFFVNNKFGTSCCFNTVTQPFMCKVLWFYYEKSCDKKVNFQIQKSKQNEIKKWKKIGFGILVIFYESCGLWKK
jgi:hypothetical protein